MTGPSQRDQFVALVGLAYQDQPNGARALAVAANQVFKAAIDLNCLAGLSCFASRRGDACGLLQGGKIVLGKLLAGPQEVEEAIRQYHEAFLRLFGSTYCGALTQASEWNSPLRRKLCRQHSLAAAEVLFDAIKKVQKNSATQS